ncbi:unnamed protein product [Trichogramma brassicae]|uniref:Uncharacterized protein n=1 Tax=Trichogramma brassicae TaxID=86971 RepID=A0A6H5IM00_9HYME|nr:unnamed protein product [Trichogramma brassicae]
MIVRKRNRRKIPAAGDELTRRVSCSSVVYRPMQFRCTRNVRACYRGGRHICLMINLPRASPYTNDEEEEKTREEVGEKEEPSDVLPGLAVMEQAVGDWAAEDEAMAIDEVEEVVEGVSERDASKEWSSKSELTTASETKSISDTDSETSGASEAAARALNWPPRKRRQQAQPEPFVDMRALGSIRSGCWKCHGRSNSHTNCPDPQPGHFC